MSLVRAASADALTNPAAFLRALGFRPAAGAAGGASTIEELPNPLVTLLPDDEGLADGADADRLTDQSGAGNHYDFNTGTTKITYHESIVNGRGVYRGSTDHDHDIVTGALLPVASSQAGDAFSGLIVFKRNGTGALYYGSSGFLGFRKWNDNQVQLDITWSDEAGSGTVVNVRTGSVIDTTTWFALLAIADPDRGSALFLNEWDGENPTVGWNAVTSGKDRVATDVSGHQFNDMNADLAECRYWKHAPSNAEIEMIGQYVLDTYGIPV